MTINIRLAGGVVNWGGKMEYGGLKREDEKWKGGPKAAFPWVVREAKSYFSMSIFFTDVNEPACSL
jgi:hypothetical protein